MRFGVVILPEHRWRDGAEMWMRAEAMGFDHAWTYDHLAWRSLRDDPWFATIPTLTAAALVTNRIRLGPLVASPNFRHPVPFAKELMTLDDISDGRLTLGIGAGGEGWDATMLGQEHWSRSERADRFGEFVELCDRVLRAPDVSHAGRYYSADGARSVPGCVQQPRVPFAIAGVGPRSMELAARHGESWVTVGHPSGELERLPELVEQVDAACVRVGRDPGSLDRLVLTGVWAPAGLESKGAFDDSVGRYAEMGFTDVVVHWPRPGGPYAGNIETFERIFS